MAIIDTIVNQLNQEKHILLRMFDRKEITEKDFHQELNFIEQQIEERNKLIIDECIKHKKRVKELREKKSIKLPEELKEKIEMTDEKNIQEKKPKKVTLAATVERALKRKSTKTINDVVEKVQEWIPERKKKSIVAMTRNVIAAVKNQNKPRWKNYTWDEEAYLLTAPVEE